MKYYPSPAFAFLDEDGTIKLEWQLPNNHALLICMFDGSDENYAIITYTDSSGNDGYHFVKIQSASDVLMAMNLAGFSPSDQ